MALESEYIRVADSLLSPHGWKVASCAIIQTLWAGYGQICRLDAIPLDPKRHAEAPHSFILKYVAPPRSRRQLEVDEGHFRKLISYQVEQYFYAHLAPAMPPNIAIAHCLGHICEHDFMAMILTDLREGYPVVPEKRGELNEAQVQAVLMWLAKFHGFWWKRRTQFEPKTLRLPPQEEAQLSSDSTVQFRNGVWLNGGYSYANQCTCLRDARLYHQLTLSSYLTTRRSEYDCLKKDRSSAWSNALCDLQHHTQQSVAELVAKVLSPSECPSTAGYQTLIHGDVKSDNLFLTPSHAEVAFFDFQYVGLGLGVCDLAKLFTCSIPVNMLDPGQSEDCKDMEVGEQQLLERYRLMVEEASGLAYPRDALEMHWKTALVDWLRFQASWGFWGNKKWLEARVSHILQDENWMSWVLDATRQTSSVA